VQGEGAAEKIAQAVRGFNALEKGDLVPRPDVLIVARGGGSLEDLMPFNEEVVVRAVAESKIPVISAVGHETDTTLVDYAADLRAPTPTGAAEKAVPVRDELLAQVGAVGLRFEGAMRRTLRERKDRIGLLGKALGDPSRAIAPLMQRFDMISERFVVARLNYFARLHSRIAEAVGRLRHPRDVVRLAAQRLEALAQKMASRGRERLMQSDKKLERLAVMLEALSPRAVLGRGYGLIYDARGHVITRVAALVKGETVRIELQDGSRRAEVQD
jgi:exodeoxyribonuclease VII large subunit